MCGGEVSAQLVECGGHGRAVGGVLDERTQCGADEFAHLGIGHVGVVGPGVRIAGLADLAEQHLLCRS